MKYNGIILGIILLILLSYSLNQKKREGHTKFTGDTFITCTKEYKYTGKIVPFKIPDGVFELDVQMQLEKQ